MSRVYSERVEKALKAAGVQPGDGVRVVKGDDVYEGVLVPSSGSQGGNSIVVKLKSGYNAGVLFDSSVKIEKTAESAGPTRFPSLDLKPRGLPKLSLVATGGTIASRVDYRTGGVHMLVTPAELLAAVPELADVADVRVVSPFALASEDMSPVEWKEIAVAVAAELNAGATGAIVTHGTDTLHYTSAALSFFLKNLRKPVAVVGAQRSPDRGSFDGAVNVVCGARYALSDFAGVCVVMHASNSDDYCHAIRGTKARKLHSSARNAFRSINALPPLRIWPGGKIERVENAEPLAARDDSVTVEVDAAFEPRVALVKVFPGADPRALDFYAENGYRGLVIEGTGLGHAPVQPLDAKTSWLPKIKELVDAGVVVGMAAQTVFGAVHPSVYSNLRLLSNAGVVYLKDMHAETALVKMGWALGHAKNADDAKKLLLSNVAGEFSERQLESATEG